MHNTQRHIISIEKCIVVLDINVARELGESLVRPGWVNTFTRMVSSGEYAFVLADGTFAELLHQITTPDGGMTDECFARMVQELEIILDPEYPIIPGKRDLWGMLGAVGEKPWCAREAKDLSTRSWQVLCDILSEPKNAQFSLMIEESLQEEREDWIAVFSKFDMHHSHNVAVIETHISELLTQQNDANYPTNYSLAELQKELQDLNDLKELGGMVLNDAFTDLDAKGSLTAPPY
ncbi:hypothetical protein KBJ94_23000 [Pseudomonas sp. ITA]|uniref:hypothetical protein n=1 Tax=Pseudomonas sp. ITA TaxID=2825841 RepID=UPI0024992EF9|nr:hypothetical protein [Pseudomonas sp. ITA]MDI2144921.1 hypothetical protein [Pseudomonas sp. ITA]